MHFLICSSTYDWHHTVFPWCIYWHLVFTTVALNTVQWEYGIFKMQFINIYTFIYTYTCKYAYLNNLNESIHNWKVEESEIEFKM